MINECGINQLRRNRALATRYDKLAVRHHATMHIGNAPVMSCWIG